MISIKKEISIVKHRVYRAYCKGEERISAIYYNMRYLHIDDCLFLIGGRRGAECREHVFFEAVSKIPFSKRKCG